MVAILPAKVPDHQDEIQGLFSEYLHWVCPRIYQEYSVAFEPGSILSHDMETLDIFLPPHGLLLLAYEEDRIAGCVCVRTLGDRIAELKRMYVKPDFRGKGIGMALVQEAIKRICAMHYIEIRLDSAGFMHDAHRLYRSAGFREIMPYEGSEIPKEFHQYWVFMKMDIV